jgi:dTDP-4-amino-4,6-dideoxygalactose transaminase
MTDVQAAIGIEQLKKLPCFLEERRKIASLYQEKLKVISWLEPPLEPVSCRTNWQSYPVKVKGGSPVSRDELMQHLLDCGISSRRGIMNAHQEPPYASIPSPNCSEKARDSVILLPLFNGMKESEVEEVVKGVMHV